MSDLLHGVNDLARDWLALPENERDYFARVIASRATWWRLPTAQQGREQRKRYLRFRKAVLTGPVGDVEAGEDDEAPAAPRALRPLNMVLTPADVDANERDLLEWGTARRAAMAFLMKPLAELREIALDEEDAEAMREVADLAGRYIEAHRRHLQLVQTARLRILAAVSDQKPPKKGTQ
jgi:hypothetical protein